MSQNSNDPKKVALLFQGNEDGQTPLDLLKTKSEEVQSAFLEQFQRLSVINPDEISYLVGVRYILLLFNYGAVPRHAWD